MIQRLENRCKFKYASKPGNYQLTMDVFPLKWFTSLVIIQSAEVSSYSFLAFNINKNLNRWRVSFQTVGKINTSQLKTHENGSFHVHAQKIKSIATTRNERVHSRANLALHAMGENNQRCEQNWSCLKGVVCFLWRLKQDADMQITLCYDRQWSLKIKQPITVRPHRC